MKSIFIVIAMLYGTLVTAQDFDGTWKSIGYGRVLTIKHEKYEIYDYTDISCIKSMNGKLSELTNKISITYDTLNIYNGINNYYFLRSNPNICQLPKRKKNDPVYNFEVLVATFDKHYAYFDERNINWEKMQEKYGAQVNENTSEIEQYLIIKEMLTEFGDGHIDFSAPKKIVSKSEALNTKTEQQAPKTKSIASWKLAEQVANAILDTVTSKRGGTIRWGIIEDNIGYLQINQMIGFGDYGIDDNASVPDFWAQYLPILSKNSVLATTADELKGISSIMDEVMTDLGDTKSIILDLRFNGGGKDEVGLEVLRHFNLEKIQVGIKKAVDETQYSPAVPIYVEAAENSYSKPVYLLTSKASASATEICVLASLSLDNITRIGGNTEGIMSDMLEKSLPNGWTFSLSNEIYLDNDGNNYEHIGITPNIVLYPSNTRSEQYKTIQNSLANQNDKAIEKAIELSKQ